MVVCCVILKKFHVTFTTKIKSDAPHNVNFAKANSVVLGAGRAQTVIS